MQEKISIVNLTRIKKALLPFSSGNKTLAKIKNDILGETYSLSIAFVDEKKSREINKKYKKKDNPTNVLSFSLRKNEGEIILCPSVIKKEVKIKKFNKIFPELVIFLVIHGMLHLKGMQHSSTMEKAEELYCKKYNEKYFSRNRHRVQDDKSRSGRVY